MCERTYRSDRVKGGVSRSLARNLMRGAGMSREEVSRPLIGVINSWTNLFSGHEPLDKIGRAVMDGVYMSGGTPVCTSTIAICDGMAQNTCGMKYSLPSRELIADSIESFVEAHGLDGIVCVCNCDKIVPGMMIAMIRLNIPSLIITAGCGERTWLNGKPIDGTEMGNRMAAAASGKVDIEQLYELEDCCCAGGAACNTGMGTALSMAMMSEVLGLSLPGNATIPVSWPQRIHLAKKCGMHIMELVEKDWKPSDFLTRQSFLNAIAVDMMIGCSTNTTLHLPALASAAGIEINLNDFDEASRKVPQIVKLLPSLSPYSAFDFHVAGAVSAVVKQGIEAGFIIPDCKTNTLKTLGENVADAQVYNTDVIRPFDNPYLEEGGLAILKGNLSPDGCVIKTGGVSPAMMEHHGTAKVYNSEEEAYQALMDGEIQSGNVMVIRYEGPKGGPGMQEMLTLTQSLAALGLADTVSLITDGRFSGASTGGVIGHVGPEAAAGGLIALIEDGDIIEYSIPKRMINLQVDEDILEERRKNWVCIEPKVKSGWLARYAQLATPAWEGAVVKADIEKE